MEENGVTLLCVKLNLSGQKGHYLKRASFCTKLENPIFHLTFKLNSAVLAASEGESIYLC